MKFATFEEVGGSRIAINPENVVSVVFAGERFTDINFVGGGSIRVAVSFADTVSLLEACGLEGRQDAHRT